MHRERRFRDGALAGMRWLVARPKARPARTPRAVEVDGRSVLARWLQRRRHGPGGRRPRTRPVRRPHRGPDLPRLRTRRSRAASAPHRSGTRPLPRSSEDATNETGFLSGSAGSAYMFLERYARDRDPADLATARRMLRWVNDQAVADGSGGLYWPISRGSAAMPAGFELGAAGIAWVNLRAYDSTAIRSYRDVARRAAVWLRSVAIAGSAWAELPGDPTVPVHIGLDSGAAGIGWVLEDLARAGVDPPQPRPPARRSRLRTHAARDRKGRSGTPTGPGAGHGCAPSPHGTGAQPGSPASPRGSPVGPAAVRAGRVAADCCSREPVSGIIAASLPAAS